MKYNQPYGVTDPDAAYVNGNPSIGRAGSIPPAAAFEYPQREIVQAIIDAGLEPTNDDLTQLSQAIKQFGRVFWGVDTGTANAVVADLTPEVTEYAQPFLAVVKKIATANSGAMTATFNGVGSRALKDHLGSDFGSAAVPASALLLISYDGAIFRVLNGTTTVNNVSELVANSGDMVEVTVGGDVNFRTARGTHDTTVGPSDRWPRGRTSDDEAVYVTSGELVSWLETQLQENGPGVDPNQFVFQSLTLNMYASVGDFWTPGVKTATAAQLVAGTVPGFVGQQQTGIGSNIGGFSHPMATVEGTPTGSATLVGYFVTQSTTISPQWIAVWRWNP